VTLDHSLEGPSWRGHVLHPVRKTAQSGRSCNWLCDQRKEHSPLRACALEHDHSRHCKQSTAMQTLAPS